MGIFKNVQKVRALIANEGVDNVVSPIGNAINKASMAAIKSGMFKDDGTVSDAWKSYMAVFADNPQQLTRLTVQAADEPDYVTQMRLYMVTSGCCDPSTRLSLPMSFNTKIDGETTNGVTTNPVVPEQPSDPNNEILDARPGGLKNIR